MYSPNYDYYSPTTNMSPTMSWWDSSPTMSYFKPNAAIAGLVDMSGSHRMGMMHGIHMGGHGGSHMGFIGGMAMPSTPIMIAGFGALLALSSFAIKGNGKKKKIKKAMLGSGALLSIGALGYNQFAA